MKSGVEVMLPTGKWISLEEELFGAGWEDVVKDLVERFHAEKAKTPETILQANIALNNLDIDDDSKEYLGNTLGLAPEWWSFLALTDPIDCISFTTEFGYVKSTKQSEFAKINKSGKIAIELRNGDSLKTLGKHLRFKVEGIEIDQMRKDINYALENNFATQYDLDSFDEWMDENRDMIFITTTDGIAVKFPIDTLKMSSRNSRGVRGIKLKDDSKVVCSSIVTNDMNILMITKYGIGKMVKVSDFRNMKRGAVGVKCLNTNAKSGPVEVVLAISDLSEEVMFLTGKGQTIRMRVSQIPIYKRQATGIKLVKLKEGDYIVSGDKIKDV